MDKIISNNAFSNGCSPSATPITATGAAAVYHDRLNEQEVALVVQSGTITDGTSYTWTITECDTTGGSYTAVDSAKVSGSAVFHAGDDDDVRVIQLIGTTKRYLQAYCTVVGSPSTGGMFSVLFVGNKLRTAPPTVET